MLVFVGALIVTALASSVWCAVDCIRAPLWARGQGTGAAVAGAALVAAGATMAVAVRVLFVPPHLAMYLDEPWYAEAACNLSRLGRLVLCHETFSGIVCVPYEKAVGWPLLMSAWTAVMGCDNTAGIEINRVLGSITVLLVAVAARCAGAAWWQAAIPAILLALHPVHAWWSATGETNVAAAAALLAGLCGALLFIRGGRLSGAALAVSGLGAAVAIRPECAVAALVAAITVARRAARTAPSRRTGVAAAIGAVSLGAAAAGLPLWAMNTAISGGGFLSPANVWSNGLDVARGRLGLVYGAIALLAVGGAGGLAHARERSALWLFGGTAIATAVVVLAYDRFHERMLLAPTVCLLPMSAFAFVQPDAVGRLRRVLLPVLALGICGVFVAAVRQPLLGARADAPETQLLETSAVSHVARVQLPADALVIAERPTVLAASGMAHVMSTADALADPAALMRRVDSGRPTYVFRDMFCEAGFPGSATPPSCERLLDQFAIAAVAEDSINSRTYGLYRLSTLRPHDVPER
jgi:hypothetical protein